MNNFSYRISLLVEISVRLKRCLGCLALERYIVVCLLNSKLPCCKIAEEEGESIHPFCGEMALRSCFWGSNAVALELGVKEWAKGHMMR